MTKEFYVAPFKDHSNCKGHANAMLDSTMETEGERESMIQAINNYLPVENSIEK